MRDELLDLYNQELSYLRRLGAEFAERNQEAASALQLDPNRSPDPHVERLLEGFAFLTARVQLRIRDDFPEIAQAILDSVYPEYARPIPAMSVAQLQIDPEQGKLSTGFRVSAGRELFARRTLDGIRCQFRTCFDTTLWPIEVTAAEIISPHQLKPPVRGTAAVAALRLELRTPPDVPFSSLDLESLRLYLDAEWNVAATLYELLLNNCEAILLREPGRKDHDGVALPASALVPVGFEADQGVLPLPRRSHLGLRLLTEYFAFPEKFLFLDLHGLDRLRAARAKSVVEVVFLLSRFELPERRAQLEAAVHADTIRLGCTPIVNLFPQVSEPIRLTQRQSEYPIIAGARRRQTMGIYSIEDVRAVVDGRPQAVGFKPLYSFRHGERTSGGGLFWHAARRPRGFEGDDLQDVFLSFVDADAVATNPDYDSVTAHLLCYDADLPRELPIRTFGGDFDLPGGGPIQTVTALVRPTQLIPGLSRGPLLWRLISLLSLNFVSLAEGGPTTLQELLVLHNNNGSLAGKKQIESVTGLSTQPMYTRIRGDHGLAFARGHRIDLTVDEEHFAGSGLYLFLSVLERFFGTHTALNSFTVLRAHSTKRREMVKEWPPRAGSKTLI